MSSQKPVVTVVTPSYNQGLYIEQTINSVLSQNYPDIEYIVMDADSSDDTVSILQKYDKHIVWRSEPDLGQSNAINKGWKQAHGSILTWLNSDDYYDDNDVISVVVEEFAKNPSSAVIYGKANYVDSRGRFLREAEIDDRPWPRICITNVVGQPNAFIAKWALQNVGLINEQLHYVMDFELWLRLICQGLDFAFLPRVIANARIHSECKTFGQSEKHLLECLMMLENFYSSSMIPDAIRQHRNEALGYWSAALGFHWVAEKKFRLASRYLIKAVKHNPKYLKNMGVWTTFTRALIGAGIVDALKRFLSGTR